MQGTLRLMAAEARELRPGGEAVITRLADILVIQAIRSWIETDPGRADRLARRAAGPRRSAARSRSSTATRRAPGRSPRSPTSWRCRARRSRRASRELVGEPVMQYVDSLADAGRARARCERSGATVGELADRLGYRSEAAFARAFKRVIGRRARGGQAARTRPEPGPTKRSPPEEPRIRGHRLAFGPRSSSRTDDFGRGSRVSACAADGHAAKRPMGVQMGKLEPDNLARYSSLSTTA